MAKETNSGTDKGKVRVRVIDFEMEGNNQTLRESIRDIVGAIKTTTVVRMPALAGAPPAAKAAPRDEAVVNGDLFEATPDVEDEVEDDVEEGGEDRPKRNYTFKSPEIVDIDLRAGEQPLKKFMASAPDSLDKRYLLVAYWFKAHRDTKEITPNHVYTAFKEMGWTGLPKDASQPLRNLKKAGLMKKGEGSGAYAINHVGEGKAEDMIKEANGGA
jgi:hypothetical protein